MKNCKNYSNYLKEISLLFIISVLLKDESIEIQDMNGIYSYTSYIKTTHICLDVKSSADIPTS